MSRFHTDDDGQNAVRDAVLGPGLYGGFLDGRYVYLDKGSLLTLLQNGLPLTPYCRDGRATHVSWKKRSCAGQARRAVAWVAF